MGVTISTPPSNSMFVSCPTRIILITLFSFGDVTVRLLVQSDVVPVSFSLLDGRRHTMLEICEVLRSKTPVLGQCVSEVRIHFNWRRLELTGCNGRVNVKLGGINLIPEPTSVSVLTDPHNPTIVMGKS